MNHFIERINSSHPTIKFTTEISDQSVNFLDTTVVLSEGCIHTTLYTKPTDKHNYLHYSSAHPHHCKDGGPYSQLLRIKRICSDPADFERNAQMILSHFERRGYPNKLVQDSLNKARSIPRSELLQPNQSDNTNADSEKVFMISDFNPSNPNFREVLTKNWELLSLKPETQPLHESQLIVGSRRAKNLHDHLVTAKTQYPPPLIPERLTPPANTCNKNSCYKCDLITNEDHCRSHITNRSYKTPHSLATCRSSNLVYLIYCTLCGMQYVGETKRQIADRLPEHLRDIRKRNDTPVSRHFNLPDHSTDKLRIQVLEFIRQNRDLASTTEYRRKREFWWIHQLKSLEPLGINIFG